MPLTKSDWLNLVKEKANERGGVCLESTYVSANAKMKFRCAQGHTWDGRAAAVLRGTWCAKCAVVEQHKAQRTPFSKIEKAILAKGGRLNTTAEEYQHKQTKLKATCSKGHQFLTTWDSLNAGRWCNACGRVTSGLKQRLDIKMAQKLAESRGGKLLSTEYLGSSLPLEWACAAGHSLEPLHLHHPACR